MLVIGPTLFATHPGGQLQSSIGTLFPRHEVIITSPPLHALQREAFKEWFQEKEAAAGRRAATGLKLSWEAAESVDLFFARGGLVMIRPELERLDLAFDADEALQATWGVPLHRISFMSVNDKRVREALRERGELWRISAPTSGPGRIEDAIAQARVAIHHGAIYYYNAQSGTRWLTCGQFAQLASLPDEKLAAQLEEVAEHCGQRNRHGHPEVAFLGADTLRFGAPNLQGHKFGQLPAEEMRARHAALAAQFREAAEPALKEDRRQWVPWQTRVFAAIMAETGGPREELEGMGGELAPKVRWLPGGCFKEGEFHFAPNCSAEGAPPKDQELRGLWDPLARGFITNFIREHSDIEYLNLGRIEGSGPSPEGARRGVYLAEIKVRDEHNPRRLLLRVLRWGLPERLDERDELGRPKDFFRAVFETEEYIDYTLDRRLGCLQFGMHLPKRVNMRRVSELYRGLRLEFAGRFLPVIYFERDFLAGMPTNRVPERKLAEPRYARALACLLGKAAAPNMIVGRSREPKPKEELGPAVFDDGDEIIVESSAGLPRDLVVVNHSGAFAGWRPTSLLAFAEAYAAPVNNRATQVPDPRAFAEAYLKAFAEEFRRIQTEYQRQPGAFEGLFKQQPSNEQGNFACRWSRVLRRLRETDPRSLVAEVRRHITVLKQAEAKEEGAEEMPSI
ncbi:MAG TPA: hypothetical protein VN829_13795 [Dongiaceae bacterium]|nr:hypothetical protein [Dongiaceae bacterium]